MVPLPGNFAQVQYICRTMRNSGNKNSILGVFYLILGTRIPPIGYLMISCLLVLGVNGRAQPPINEEINDTIIKDDLGEVTDRFQELFFNALAQNGIENYDRAIHNLKESLELAPDKSVIYFQLGKNFRQLDETEQAITYFNKAREQRPEERAILTNLFELYGMRGDLPNAIELGEKLALSDPDYYLDLAKLQVLNQNDKKALAALSLLDIKENHSSESETLRQKIYRETKQPQVLIEYIQKQSQHEPLNPVHYKGLVYLQYFHQNPDETYKSAISLQKIAPETIEVPLGLYRYYRDKGKDDLAVQNMTRLIQEENIDKAIKMQVIKDFSQFVKDHPQYEDRLIAALDHELGDQEGSHQELAHRYKERDPEKALEYLEKAVKEDPQDFELIRETLLLQLQVEDYQKASALAEQALSYFPTQSFLYLSKGQAENALGNYKDAESDLLDGVDFAIDNQTLLSRFYQALIEVYKNLNRNDQVTHYEDLLRELKN